MLIKCREMLEKEVAFYIIGVDKNVKILCTNQILKLKVYFIKKFNQKLCKIILTT